MTKDNFCNFYEKKSKVSELTVWGNLEACGIRHDLKYLSELEKPEVKTENLPRFKLSANGCLMKTLIQNAYSEKDAELQRAALMLLSKLPPDPATFVRVVENSSFEWL